MVKIYFNFTPSFYFFGQHCTGRPAPPTPPRNPQRTFVRHCRYFSGAKKTPSPSSSSLLLLLSLSFGIAPSLSFAWNFVFFFSVVVIVGIPSCSILCINFFFFLTGSPFSVHFFLKFLFNFFFVFYF